MIPAFDDLYDAAVTILTDDLDVTADDVESYRATFVDFLNRYPGVADSHTVAYDWATGAAVTRARHGQRGDLVALPGLFAHHWTSNRKVVPSPQRTRAGEGES